MTIASHHPINEVGLLNALKVLRNSESARLYFVVPPALFAMFSKQSIKRSASSIDEPPVKLAQFVLEVEV